MKEADEQSQQTPIEITELVDNLTLPFITENHREPTDIFYQAYLKAAGINVLDSEKYDRKSAQELQDFFEQTYYDKRTTELQEQLKKYQDLEKLPRTTLPERLAYMTDKNRMQSLLANFCLTEEESGRITELKTPQDLTEALKTEFYAKIFKVEKAGIEAIPTNDRQDFLLNFEVSNSGTSLEIPQEKISIPMMVYRLGLETGLGPAHAEFALSLLGGRCGEKLNDRTLEAGLNILKQYAQDGYTSLPSRFERELTPEDIAIKYLQYLSSNHNAYPHYLMPGREIDSVERESKEKSHLETNGVEHHFFKKLPEFTQRLSHTQLKHIFVRAIRRGDIDSIKALILSPNIDTDLKGTLLRIAARYNSKEVVEELLKQTDIDAWTKGQALRIAAKTNSKEVVEELLKQTDIDAGTKGLALRDAAKTNSKEVVEELLKQTNIDAEYKGEALRIAAKTNSKEVVEELLKQTDIKAWVKGKALRNAAEKNAKGVMEELLKQTDISAGVKGQALMYAAQNNAKEVVEELLKQTDIDAEPKGQALRDAARNNSKEVVEELLKQTDIQARDKGEALIIAVEKNAEKAVEELLKQTDIQAGAKGVALMSAVLNNSKDIVEELLKQTDIKPGTKGVALMSAARKNYKDIVEELLKQTDIPAGAKGEALCDAALNNAKKVVEELLKQTDIDVNTQDNDGDTPLMVALRSQYFDIAEALLQNGADASIKNYQGVSASEVMGGFKELSPEKEQQIEKISQLIAQKHSFNITTASLYSRGISQGVNSPGTKPKK